MTDAFERAVEAVRALGKYRSRQAVRGDRKGGAGGLPRAGQVVGRDRRRRRGAVSGSGVTRREVLTALKRFGRPRAARTRWRTLRRERFL